MRPTWSRGEHWDSHNVSVLLGVGDGTFAAVHYAAGNEPYGP